MQERGKSSQERKVRKDEAAGLFLQTQKAFSGVIEFPSFGARMGASISKERADRTTAQNGMSTPIRSSVPGKPFAMDDPRSPGGDRTPIVLDNGSGHAGKSEDPRSPSTNVVERTPIRATFQRRSPESDENCQQRMEGKEKEPMQSRPLGEHN